jgi:copper resistance protein B
MSARAAAVALALLLFFAGSLARAQQPEDDHSTMDHSKAEPSKSDHSEMDHSKMDHSDTGESDTDHSSMDHSKMAHSKTDHSKMDHFKMDHAPAPDAPRTPIPPLSDADRAAAFPANLHGHETHDQRIVSFLQFNRLEAWDADHGTGQAWEATAWVGNDWNRLWLRSEGEREGGRTESADLEVLYGRPVAPWWDMVAGIRHDVRPGPSQTWLALGVVGLAPYKFEVSATAYLGESGRAAARIEAEYELLLTNRWILQPLVEVELHGKADPARGVGSGLGTIEAGARLRYEFSRRFAPYVGLVWERAFGDTADFRSSEGEHVDDTRLVAGVRFAF